MVNDDYHYDNFVLLYYINVLVLLMILNYSIQDVHLKNVNVLNVHEIFPRKKNLRKEEKKKLIFKYFFD